MDYTQLKTPNLNVIGQNDDCLLYVRSIFGAPAKYAYAYSAWQNTQFPHPDIQPPNNVAVPIWFSWTGTVGGVTQNWGHVALWDNGTIYSTTAQGDKTFSSIQALVEYIKEDIEYLGWSEDINNVRVVEGEDMNPTSNQVGVVFPGIVSDSNFNPIMPTQDQLNTAVSTDWYDWIVSLLPNVTTLRDTIANLEDERNNTLYPFVNAICADLKIPITTDLPTVAAAITALQKGGTTLNANNVEAYIQEHLS